jgi:hypothetical protein
MTRQNSMRTLATISALLVLVLLGGCGEEATSTSPDKQPQKQAQWRDCTGAALEQAAAVKLGILTQSGGQSVVKLVGEGDGPCAGGLVARTAAGVTGVDVEGLDLEAGTAKVVDLSGRTDPRDLLLVNGGTHPRGGFQPHLFVLGDGLHEVMEDGNPLLPFVATDGGGTPMTATCAHDGKVAVLTATTSEPPGVILAWDVQRTTYRINAGGEAVLVGTKQVRDHAADPTLRKEMPGLFEPDAFFADCVRSSP